MMLSTDRLCNAAQTNCCSTLNQHLSQLEGCSLVSEGLLSLNALQSGLDVRDAGVNSLLQDVAALLQLLAQQGGKSLVSYLANQVLPPLSLEPQLQVRIN